MSRTRVFLGLWLVLLIASHIWRQFAAPLPTDSDLNYTTLKQRDGDQVQSVDIRLAYREFGETADDKPSILLLHGTPVASTALIGLAELLATEHHVLIPDLPGFGGSSQVLPDYSSLTHGQYLADWLKRDLQRPVHVIAYSQGGAAAITLTAEYPDLTRSLTLIATIGVQELELFGNYAMNHAVYEGQLALLRAAQWLIPHFGAFDDAILGTGYARNLTDTDQRPLREMLVRISAPTLIVHGRDDGLVPFAAAEEHHRLIAQSTLQAFDGGHELAYATPAVITPAIEEFLRMVESGQALNRDNAAPARLTAAHAVAQMPARAPLTGAALLVMVLAIIVASYVSEDLACIAAGILAAQGVISFATAVLASLVGLFTGDLALFAFGRWAGGPTLARFVSNEKLADAKQWLQRRGPAVIVASRFMPGTRLPTYLAAGALQMPWLRFSGFFALATMIWTPILVGLAMLYGEIATDWLARYSTMALPVAIAGVLALFVLSKVVPPLFTWQGRRLARSRWIRLTNFEYWPRSAFYPVIVLYCVWLAIRYRSATLFTLANPAIPLGGLVGESKSDILRALDASGAVPPFELLIQDQPGERIAALGAFMAREQLNYPVVLKPDLGQRGQDVCIAETEEEACDYIADHPEATIAQAFIRGEEFGVFYIRLPNEPHGFIFSVTHKGKTSVTGDGEQSLKALILNDARAIGMASFFLETHRTRLHDVPATGEVVALNAIGTHSRGSLFTDAHHLVTDQLIDTIDSISQHFDGFYFGRYDLIAPSREAFSEGQDLKIIELNGVSSEATHMYDPALGVLNAWKVTATQWHYAFRIGDQMRARGSKPAKVSDLIRALRTNDY